MLLRHHGTYTVLGIVADVYESHVKANCAPQCVCKLCVQFSEHFRVVWFVYWPLDLESNKELLQEAPVKEMGLIINIYDNNKWHFH